MDLLFSFYSGYTSLNFSRNEASVNIIFLLARCDRKSYAMIPPIFVTKEASNFDLGLGNRIQRDFEKVSKLQFQFASHWNMLTLLRKNTACTF